MKIGSRTWRSLAQVLALGLVSARAAADVGPICAEDTVVAPPDGASDVPLNARIWGESYSGRTRLIGPAGEVESEQRYFPLAGPVGSGLSLPVLVPSEPLLPRTQYRVEDEVRPEEYRQFATGDAIDEDAPALPVLASVENSVGTHLEFAFDGILVAASEPLGTFESFETLLEPPGFERGYFALDASEPLFTLLTQQASLEFATGPCARPLPEAGVSAHFAVFDLTGNFSGWSDLVEVDPPADVWQRPVIDDLSNVGPTPAPQPQATQRSHCSLGALAPRQGHPGALWAMTCGLLGLAMRRHRRPSPAPPTRPQR